MIARRLIISYTCLFLVSILFGIGIFYFYTYNTSLPSNAPYPQCEEISLSTAQACVRAGWHGWIENTSSEMLTAIILQETQNGSFLARERFLLSPNEKRYVYYPFHARVNIYDSNMKLRDVITAERD